MIARCISSLVTPAAVEPITLSQAKLYLRVPDSGDDALVTGLITAARQWIESYCRRSLVNQTFDLAYPCFFEVGEPLLVPHAPLASVTSVKYYDETGAIQTLAADQYNVRVSAGAFAGRGSIEADQDASLPSLNTYIENPVIVRAVCGYGATAADVPAGIVAALYLKLGDLYEQRQESVVGTVVGKTQTTVAHLLAPYRLLEIV